MQLVDWQFGGLNWVRVAWSRKVYMRLATGFRTTSGVIYRSFVIVQLRDRPQNFTFALEALLLGQIFIYRKIYLSRGLYHPTYQLPEGV